MGHQSVIRGLVVVAAFGLLVACESTHYGAMESVGYHKRDILVDRVEDAMESQEAAKAEFENAFEQFSSVVSVPPSKLRASSLAQFRESQQATDLIAAMRRAEARMAPVLATFRDCVLYLKHNLNAQAVASLKGELSGVEADVSSLIREMEASISEVRAFVTAME